MRFFSALLDETAARRKRLRQALGDRGQSLFEFALLTGLVIGAGSFYLRDWLAAYAPLTLLLPFAFVLGYGLIEARRQSEFKAGAAEESVRKRYDLAALAWAILCGGLGLGLLCYAMTAKPPPAPATGWEPPRGTVATELGQ
ncbi:MAG: hypothetical protein AB7L65_08960 [Hyphomonadaceae bacterium]